MNQAVNRVQFFIRPQDGMGTAGGLLYSLALKKHKYMFKYKNKYSLHCHILILLKGG